MIGFLKKIKDIRQRFSIGITTGSRSESAKIILEHYDKLVLVWSRSGTIEPINYGIYSSCVNEYSTNGGNIADESNTSTSSSSSINKDIADEGSSGSGINSTNRSNRETAEIINKTLSNPETDLVIKKTKKNLFLN